MQGLRPARMWSSSVATIVAVTAIAWASRAPACPESCLTGLRQGGDFCTSAATLDTLIADPACGPHARFSIPHGNLFLFSIVSIADCGSTLTVEDDFLLDGLPPGTPVTISAVYHVRVEGGCAGNFSGGSAGAGMSGTGTSATEHTWSMNGPCAFGCVYDTVWASPLSVVAGTPFRMRYFAHVQIGDLCSAAVRGQFFFDGLPSGVFVTSCNGANLVPVPAARRSWGSVKANYR